MFGAMTLCAYALFLHLGVLLVLLAVASRRSLRAALSWGTAALLLGAVALDAFVIEPAWLEVSHVTLKTRKLQKPLRVVVLSDIQYDEFGEYQRDAYRRVLEQHPDMILMTGDYVQVSSREERARLVQSTRAFLREIDFSAPLGVYAVRGNVETDDWRSMFEGTSVKAFERTGRADVQGISIRGLSLDDSFYEGLHAEEAGGYGIVFGHCPNFALGDVHADLLVAGHTHGGQVRLPVLGPIITMSAVPRAWAAGATALSGGRALVVSRGIGMERGAAPRLRFLCRPEIVVIDVGVE
jgi:predicted MPP superfamily phosphohydrolase